MKICTLMGLRLIDSGNQERTICETNQLFIRRYEVSEFEEYCHVKKKDDFLFSCSSVDNSDKQNVQHFLSIQSSLASFFFDIFSNEPTNQPLLVATFQSGSLYLSSDAFTAFS
jgi:hypothetical protein